MNQLNSPIEIYQLLEKTNCKECNEATCIAFAFTVFKGQKQLDECPYLSNEIAQKHKTSFVNQTSIEQIMDEKIAEYKIKIADLDLRTAAERLGATFENGKLTIKCFGKKFSFDNRGNIQTEIHINYWVTKPLLDYIINGTGIPVSGNWVSFRDLKNGKPWYRLFDRKCKKPFKKIADTYTDFFHDILHIFNGKQVENHYHSDISLVLYPLPRIPILICYWKPEDDLESDLNIFFDSTATENLNIESLYMLSTGLAMMFEKISLRHSG